MSKKQPYDPTANIEAEMAAVYALVPKESWVETYIFRVMGAVLGGLLLLATWLPLVGGNTEVADVFLRIGDFRTITSVLAGTLIVLNLLGIFRLGIFWLRSAVIAVAGLHLVWALVLYLEIHDVGMAESLSGARPGIGLWLMIFWSIAAIVVALFDGRTVAYAEALAAAANQGLEKYKVNRAATLTRVSLKIALRKYGPEHPYTMFHAANHGANLVWAGYGKRARKIADQLFPILIEQGREYKDPFFHELRVELSKKGF